MPSGSLNDRLAFIEIWIYRVFSLLCQAMTTEFSKISMSFESRGG